MLWLGVNIFSNILFFYDLGFKVNGKEKTNKRKESKPNHGSLIIDSVRNIQPSLFCLCFLLTTLWNSDPGQKLFTPPHLRRLHHPFRFSKLLVVNFSLMFRKLLRSFPNSSFNVLDYVVWLPLCFHFCFL